MNLLKRLNLRNIDRFIVLHRYCSSEKPATDNKWTETALVKVQGRMYHWLDAYEDFVGLTEVKYAQDQVTQVGCSQRY